MGEFVLIMILATGTPRVATNHVYFATQAACEHARSSMLTNKMSSRWIEYGECFPTGLNRASSDIPTR